MANEIGIGIIGTGFARRVQIPAFRSCENARIASVASGTIENARATAEEFGVEHFTDDWRETIGRDDVQLVCVTTPPRLHREMTLAAIERGKHILCEKPMAMNVTEAAEMTEAANRGGILALIDHELRFQPGRLHARKLLHDGEIGNIRHVKYHFQAPHRGDPEAEWNWWSDESEGGGALGAIASHVIDSFNWFLGTTISSVFCQLQTHIKQRRDRGGELSPVTSDDESLLVLRFSETDLVTDATGLVSVSMTEYPDYKNRIEFYGSKGAMVVEHRGEVYVGKPEAKWQTIEVPMGQAVPGVADTGFSRGFMEFAPRIIEAIRRGEGHIENAATFEDGLSVQRVLDAARESDRTGRSIAINAAAASS